MGKERVVYKTMLMANSPEEAKQKFLGILKRGDHNSYDMYVSGIEIEVDPTEEEA
jgi:hypothetical protein